MTNLICRIVGHNTHDQPIRSVGSSRGRKMRDPDGTPLEHPVAYHMRECKRCGRYQPVTEEDAILKREIDDYINGEMNRARAAYGMGWKDFSR